MSELIATKVAEQIVEEIDKTVERNQYMSRSDFVRTAIREKLAREAKQ